MFELSDRQKHERQQMLDGLKALIQLYETYPNLPATDVKLYCSLDGGEVLPKQDCLERLAYAARAVGRTEKAFVGSTFFIKHEFNSVVGVRYMISREAVCKKTVTKVEVPEEVIPAHVKEDTTWECDMPSFLKDEGGAQ